MEGRMTEFPYHTALIVGTGPGISASLARRLSALGAKIGLVARDVNKLGELAAETGAITFKADAPEATAVAALFADVDKRLGEPDIVVYNASARAHGPLAELDPTAVEKALAVTAFGGFLVTQQAARRMVSRGHGAILLTGATASAMAFTSLISSSMEPCAGHDGRTPRTTPTALSIRTRLLRLTSTCCASIVAP